MSNTGDKTTGKGLEPLALSADDLVWQHSTSSPCKKPTHPAQHADSYAQRLQMEWAKVLGQPPTDQILQMQAADAAQNPVLELEMNQICSATPGWKQQLKKPDFAPETFPVAQPHDAIVTRPDISLKPQENHIKLPPRALPFSEKAYVRVKVISQAMNSDTPATEQICWMQRDAIKHYLTVQEMEQRRAATKGAIYGSFRYDA